MTENEKRSFIIATSALLGGGPVRHSAYTDEWFMFVSAPTSFGGGAVHDETLRITGRDPSDCRINFIRYKVPGFKFPWE